jgi:hypothetical protein
MTPEIQIKVYGFVERFFKSERNRKKIFKVLDRGRLLLKVFLVNLMEVSIKGSTRLSNWVLKICFKYL